MENVLDTDYLAELSIKGKFVFCAWKTALVGESPNITRSIQPLTNADINTIFGAFKIAETKCISIDASKSSLFEFYGTTATDAKIANSPVEVTLIGVAIDANLVDLLCEHGITIKKIEHTQSTEDGVTLNCLEWKVLNPLANFRSDIHELKCPGAHSYIAFRSVSYEESYREVPRSLAQTDLIRFFGDYQTKSFQMLTIDLHESSLFSNLKFSEIVTKDPDVIASVSFVTTELPIGGSKSTSMTETGSYHFVEVPNKISQKTGARVVDSSTWGIMDFVSDSPKGASKETAAFVPKMPGSFVCKNEDGSEHPELTKRDPNTPHRSAVLKRSHPSETDIPEQSSLDPPRPKVSVAVLEPLSLEKSKSTSSRKLKIIYSIDSPTKNVLFVSSTKEDYPGIYSAYPTAGKVISLLRDSVEIHSIKPITFLAGASEISQNICKNLRHIPQWQSEYNRVESPAKVGEGFIIFLKDKKEEGYLQWFSKTIILGEWTVHINSVEPNLSNFRLREDLEEPSYTFICPQNLLLSVDGDDTGVPVAKAEAPVYSGSSDVYRATPQKKTLQIFRTDPTVKTPAYATPGSSGFDLSAHLVDPLPKSVVVQPREIMIIPTGLKMAIPEGFEVQIRSRSGLSCKGIVVANGIGSIDSDYRGELKVLIANIGLVPYEIKHEERIAQAMVCPIVQVAFTEVSDEKELGTTQRGQGGLGSTGK